MGSTAMSTIKEDMPQLRIGHRYVHRTKDGQWLAVIHGDCLGHGSDGVICGHIHSACLEDHAPVRVLNTGCWTHPPGTFLVETADGC